MITKRTLTKWRREALEFEKDTKYANIAVYSHEMSQRILRMTQELLDQHLLRKG